MNVTTLKGIRDSRDKNMFRLRNLNHEDEHNVYDNSVIVIHKVTSNDHKLGQKIRNVSDSMVQTSTDNVLIPHIDAKLSKDYHYIFCSIVKKKIDPDLEYQFDSEMILHRIVGCDDEGNLWCEKLTCIELYKLIGKFLYNSILEGRNHYGNVIRLGSI